MTIYLDEVFVVNFLMDWLLLWLVGSLARVPMKQKRFLSGALIGAVYSLLIFLPWGQWLAGWLGKVLCSLCMVLAAYRPKTWRSLGKCFGYLYLVAFALGGAAIASVYFFGQRFIETWNGIALVKINFQLFWLVVGMFVILILALLLQKNIRRDLNGKPWIIQLRIGLAQKESEVTVLVDTGNDLTEPLTSLPVVLIEQEYLQALLPEAMQQGIAQEYTADGLFLAGVGTEMAARLRLIPYHSVGQQGMLLGFRPDWLIVEDGVNHKVHTEVIVALSKQKFSPYGIYHGLAQPDLL